MREKIVKLLNKFFITRYFLGLLIAIKFIFVDKKFVKPKDITYAYIINDFAYYFAKERIEKDEYFFMYNFFKYKKCEKKKYITRQKFATIEKTLSKDIRDIFWNKEKFLMEYKDYVKRKWIDFENCKENEIIEFLDKTDKIIIKPKNGSLGIGIKTIKTCEIKDKKEFAKEYINSSQIAEEYIIGNKEIQEFHENSLNTIRVVTFSNDKKFIPFGAFFRMGNNNLNVDNAHAGGIFATIDIETGIIISKGITTKGEEYILHPYSGKQIIGFKIPKWDEIINVCEKASKQNSKVKIAGWDITVKANNEIEIIEANHMPDFDVMQAPLKIGLKNELKKVLNEMYDIKLGK